MKTHLWVKMKKVILSKPSDNNVPSLLRTRIIGAVVKHRGWGTVPLPTFVFIRNADD